jgi:creatinine amidohydrolase
MTADESRPIFATEMTSPEFGEAVKAGRFFILPYGAMEEHGPHLPLGTDTIQPQNVARELALRLDAIILPTVHYGLCSSTANFPGTITITFDTLRAITRDLLNECVRHGIRDILLLSGHAGRTHMAAIKIAAEEVVKANPDGAIRPMVLSDYDLAYGAPDGLFPPDDGHGGDIETSRIMLMRPELVKGEGPACWPEFPKYLVVKHPEKAFPPGVWGDPTRASAEKGKKMNDYLVDELEGMIRKEFGR